MIDVQSRLNLPLTTLTVGVTGGALAPPNLFKDIRKVLGCKKMTVGKNFTLIYQFSTN